MSAHNFLCFANGIIIQSQQVGICLLLVLGLSPSARFWNAHPGRVGPGTLGLALGFIPKPADPAVAIPVMSQYQQEGTGVADVGKTGISKGL